MQILFILERDISMWTLDHHSLMGVENIATNLKAQNCLGYLCILWHYYLHSLKLIGSNMTMPLCTEEKSMKVDVEDLEPSNHHLILQPH